MFAARDSELVHLPEHSFELMLQRNTRAIHNMSRILGDRLAHSPVERDPSRMPIRCISLIPASPMSNWRSSRMAWKTGCAGMDQRCT